MRRRSFARALILFAAFVGSGAGVVSARVTMAPRNPEYTQWWREYAATTHAIERGHALGYLPPPFKQPILRVARDSRGVVGAPSAYDLRDIANKVPPVRNQGACGSCWTFATFASLETFLRPLDVTDLSENNLNNSHGFDPAPCSGGNAYMSTAYLTRWGGPVLESQDPYAPSPGSPAVFPPYKHVQEVLFLPAMADATDTGTIKDAIIGYGGVYVNYYSSSTYYYDNSTSTAFYHPSAESTNHAVCIIGWDDDYASTNFKPGDQPPGDGAWLVRNSWDTDWADDGYFWCSYHDSKFGKSSVVTFHNAESPTNYLHIYSHDPLGNISSLSTSYAANVFTAAAAHKLKAISFYTEAGGAGYSVSVYRNPLPAPAGGTPVATMAGAFTYAGYHTVSLPGAVSVAPGDTFSVCVYIANGGSYPSAFEIVASGYSSAAEASPGESYYSIDGLTWTDLTHYNATANFCIKAFAANNNAPTTPTACTISPTDPTTASDLTVSASGSTDVDATDVVSYEHQWRKSTDGSATWGAWGNPGATLPSALTAKGEQWQARSRATDGTEAGPWLESAAVTVLNTAPTAPTACAISPTTPTTTSELVASASGSTDADVADAVTYEYQWRKSTDGGVTWGGWGGAGDTISAADTARGERWQARGRATDGTASSAWRASAAVIVVNAPPTAPTTCSVSPSQPRTGADLTVSTAGSTDEDPTDTVTYEHQWRRSTDAGATWGDWGADGDTIAGADTAKGEQWQARGRATDGTDPGPWLESGVVTIHGVSITAGPAGDPSPVFSGDAVSCSVTAVDSLGQDITYLWTAEDGAGSFDDPTGANPTWTAPENNTDADADYVISVTVTCADPTEEPETGQYTQTVRPISVGITSGPSGDPRPVPSGGDLACTVAAQESRAGRALSYVWTAGDGAGNPVGRFDNAAAQNPTWTAPPNTSDSPVTCTIAVTVSCQDDPSINASGSFAVDVEPVPHTVTLSEGPATTHDTVGSAGSTNCTCAAVDSRSGHTVSYVWTARDADGDAVSGFNDATAQNPIWTAPANVSDGVEEYTLSVVALCADHPDVNDTGSCTVRVNPVAHSVAITRGPSGSPNRPASGGSLLCDVQAEDSRGHGLTYLWAAADEDGHPAGSFDDEAEQSPVWQAPENRTDATRDYVLTVTVSCAEAPTVNASASFAVGVDPVEHTVAITEGPTSDAGPVASGGAVNLHATATDSRTGHTVCYTWTATDTDGNPAGSFDDACSQSPVWTAPENRGDGATRYRITCTATCAGNPDIRDVRSITRDVSPVAHQVRITAGPHASADAVEAGGRVPCTVTAECSRDGHALRYAWSAVDAHGVPAGTFTGADTPTPVWHAPAIVPAESNEYRIRVTVTCREDPSLTARASCTQRVIRPPHEIAFTQAPHGPGEPVNSGATVQMGVAAADTLGHEVTYLWAATDGDGKPSGSFDDPERRDARWTAPANTTGRIADYDLAVTVTCADDTSVTATGSVRLQVRPAALHEFASGTRMIGVPVNSAAPPDVWTAAGIPRAAWWDPALRGYVDHDAADPFQLGRGYWAHFDAATTLLVHGTPVTDAVEQQFAPGWQMISSPYQYELSLEAMTGSDNLMSYAWTDQGNGYELVAGIRDALNLVHHTLNPWWGYWVKADGRGTIDWSPGQAAAKMGSVELLRVGGADADLGGWQLQLVVEAGGRVDACNFLGLAGDAVAQKLDIANPPLNPAGLDLYFPSDAGPMATDIRPPVAGDISFGFVVECGIDAPVRVTFPDLCAIPGSYRLTLTDVAAGKTLNMRTSHAYEYSGVGTRSFRIDVVRGNGNTLTVGNATALQVGDGAAAISYTLSAAADVSVDIRNISGRTVARIAAAEARAGANTTTWNLRGRGGARVPAGTYLCTITARADDGTQAGAIRALEVRR